MSAGDSTIFALASGAGRAGVAVLRVSGPAAFAILAVLTRKPPPPPRRAVLARLLDRAGSTLDDAIILCFPTPHSFTGEDVVELHVHGGPAVIEAVSAALLEAGAAPAQPGEFTRRAFENGKLDLAQAEALADLVDAETEGQRRQAQRQLEGALLRQTESWREGLLEALALCEAEIDFPDEDLPGALAARAARLLEPLADDLRAHLADGSRGERVREGYRVAILGAPNAGKSSLLNALAGREAAIVSDIPGTTRDVVEVRLVIAGYPVWIADTAGLRESADAIESEGVRRALQRAEDADLRLLLIDGAHPAASLALLAPRAGARALWVVSKADLPSGNNAAGLPEEALAVSAVTGEGLPALREALERRVAADLDGAVFAPLSRARQRREVETALTAVERAMIAGEPELAAEDLRAAAAALARLTGRIDVEDVLDEIFSKFCIGK